MNKKIQDGHHFQNGHWRKFKKLNKILEPSNLVSKCIDYHTGVFYPTGIREGIYCDLLAITTLNLVIISPNTKCRGYIVFAPFLIIIIFLSSVLSELFRENRSRGVKTNLIQKWTIMRGRSMEKKKFQDGRHFQNGRHRKFKKFIINTIK